MEEKVFSLRQEPGPLKWPPVLWPISMSLFPYPLHSQLYHTMPFPYNVYTFHQQFYPNFSRRREWSQTADDSHPRSTRPLRSLSDRSFRHFQRGRRLLNADRSCLGLDGEPHEKSSSKLSCTFGTKSELAVAQAKVSALSGAARGKEFQLGEKSCSDGWMILSSVCNSSPSVPSPVPMRIRECARPPSQSHTDN